MSSIFGKSLSGGIVMRHTTHEGYEAIVKMRYRCPEVAIKGIQTLLKKERAIVKRLSTCWGPVIDRSLTSTTRWG